MKKLLLLLVLTLLPMVANADAVEINGIYYNIIKGKYAEVTANPNMYIGNIVIPETIEYEGATCIVISIGSYAFYGCVNLTSITIPESVTSIKDCAFFGCTSLTSFTIPNKVYEIGNAAFSGCISLSSFIIPNSVTQIGPRAFEGCI